jgi:hypothetical protein
VDEKKLAARLRRALRGLDHAIISHTASGDPGLLPELAELIRQQARLKEKLEQVLMPPN